uniref:UDP-N-acetylmuramoyl-L-alanyl-D-glutamate--2,6-diaminopimelate ligase n=1 Tax=Candidatus Kentrum sp. DK TaxID=2126562 RepID=A0A450RZ05_9GAMM|nr:MAG: UDP-N-acetylmuramoylalanyl-D-glutamate--2,6-diaminopimelate ligase [Candidatus Kentron sp. DK]
MTTIRDITKGLALLRQPGRDDLPINALRFDSRQVQKGDVFFAVRGTRIDGHRFIGQAIENGARVIVREEPFPEDDAIPGVAESPVEYDARPIQHPGQHLGTLASGASDEDVFYLVVPDVNEALGIAAANYYGAPSRALKLIGVTGTNGKTTVATLLHRLFRKLGYKAGLLSTIENRINDQILPATHTTPDALAINRLLREMADAGCQYGFMEVSSHALAQRRTAGLTFAGAIFTNLSQDHLDYHRTLDNYREAKKTLFDTLPDEAFALVNADDASGGLMLAHCRAHAYRYGLERPADFSCRIARHRFDGMELEIDGERLTTSRLGRFNAYNLLAVYAGAVLLGQPREQVRVALEDRDGALGRIPGRFEAVRSEQGVTAIIDYAHTPDALENVLRAIRHIRDANQQIITVVGAGGDRDRTKRPHMARIAAHWSDRLILTSDNPRSEEPAAIVRDMQQGIDKENEPKVTVILDRRQAIETALEMAEGRTQKQSAEGDIVLIAGKGHETYQETKGVRRHFDDREVVMTWMDGKGEDSGPG